MPRLRRFEPLESRRLLSATRIVAWNTANGPNNAAEDADFRTVFAEIGSQSYRGGDVIAPGIIALQETDRPSSQSNYDGVDSIARIEAILEGLYPTTDYARAVTTLDTGGDATGFVYDTGLFDLVSTSVVDPLPGDRNFAHDILRGQFRPDGGTSLDDFYLYSTHLKAGSGGDNPQRRDDEAAAIRADIETLGSGIDVVVMGDFNIGGASEDAYRNFLAAGTGQLFDPIDRPGEWKNNSAFSDIHTQNPEVNGPGGMDDRFDFQLVSDTVLNDAAGIQYITNSYRAFGNDDTHVFNSDITTDNGRAGRIYGQTVRDALAAASDHLPVVVDYELAVDSPGLEINPGDGVVVSESGVTDTYTVVLSGTPTANVSVTITADAQTTVATPGNTGGSTATLTFTPATASTPQTITVAAVDDSIAEGPHTAALTHTVSSTDPAFTGIAPRTIDVSIVDNDGPPPVTDLVITEIMYNPNSNEPDGEWIELYNPGPAAVDISGWLFDDEDQSDWSPVPSGTPAIPGGGVAVVHNEVIASTNFRSVWNVPASAVVVGVPWGSLANGPSPTSEILQLLDADGDVVDEVNFDDEAPWPADNNESSIYLIDVLSDNSVGENWVLSTAGVDDAINPSGSTFSSLDTGSPGRVPSIITDAVPPRITGLKVAASGWTDTFRDFVDPDDGVGLSMTGPGQTRNLSYTGIDTFEVTFTEDVVIDAADVTVAGSEVAAYAASLDYDADSFTATITLATPIDRDSIRLTLSDSVTDAAGNPLDGEWTDDVTTLSGDGIAGGDASIRLDVLPGDVDDSGSVNIVDVLRIIRGVFDDVDDPDYDPALDIDGNGSVTIFDVFTILPRIFDTLPSPPPVPVTTPMLAIAEKPPGLIDQAVRLLDVDDV